MSDEEYVEEQPQQYMPEPSAGMPENPGIEQTKFLSENEVFEYDEKNNVIGGDLPPIIKHYFWAFLAKDMVLSWIRNDRDVRKVMQKLEINIKSFRMSLEPGQYTLEMLRHLDNLRTIVFMKILRSYEGFERRQQSTSIHHNIVGQMDNQMTRKPTGVGKWVGGMFGQ